MGINLSTGPTGSSQEQHYEQVEGGKWQTLVHPDDASDYIGAFQRAVREHAPFRAEARVRRADGQWRWLGSYAEPRFSPGGEYLGHVGLSADITERKQAEQAREFQHSLIRAILDVSLDGILVVNDENLIVSHNKKFLDVWQIPLLDIPANSAMTSTAILSALVDRVKDPDAFLKRVRELYADPDANDHCEIELKDGRTLERYSTSLRSEGRHTAGACGSFGISPSAGRPSKPCRAAKRSFASWRKTFAKCFG